MRQKIDVSIIIVSYNTSDLTLACLKSIQDTVKHFSYEVIVVDNASSDDSAEKLSQFRLKMENLTVITNKSNEGFSKANNKGVACSVGRYVLFLNSDTVVYKGTLDGMVEFMDTHELAGAATCFLETPDGNLDDASHRGFPTPWRSFAHFSGLSRIFPHTRLFSGYGLGHLDLTKTHEIDCLAGAFMLVRRQAGEDAGWWDEDYFWYGEDIDFCYMLHEKGWKIYFVPQYRILHYKGASGGIKKDSRHLTKASPETKRRVTQARFNAMRIFYNKHYKNKYPKIVTGIIFAGIWAKQAITQHGNNI